MKTALLYLALVGAPIALLLGVLQVGGLAEAPPAIGGTWRLERASCAVPEGALRIEQSGEFVQVSAARRPDAVARLRGGVLRTGASAPAACDGPLTVEARVGKDERIAGTLGVAGCAACPPAAFVAVREVEERLDAPVTH